jgi:hypothetical protein
MNLSVDSAIPTWFASALLASAGLLAFALASRAKQKADRLAWIGLGIIGFLLSIDEVATIHERWGELASGSALSSNALGYSWVLGGLVLVGVVGVVYLPFLVRLNPRTRRLLVVAGLVFIAGAIGFEIVNGRIELADPSGERFLVWSLLTGVEELLEFLGTSLLVYALLDALAGPNGTVLVAIDRG